MAPHEKTERRGMSNAFTSVRPKARPGKSAGIPKPDMNSKRYPGFVLENREIGRANTELRRAISKAAV